jgi:replication factor A1
VDEAYALYQWRMSGGETAPSASMSTGGGGGGPVPLDQRITIASIKDDGLGMKEKPDYVTVKGTVTYIRHENDPWYTACPTPNCNRKVVEGFNQQWTCEKCNQEFPNVRHNLHVLFPTTHSLSSSFRSVSVAMFCL